MDNRTVTAILEELHLLTDAQILVFRPENDEAVGIPDSFMTQWYKEEPKRYIAELRQGLGEVTIWYTYPFLYNIILPLTHAQLLVCIGPISIKAIDREQAYAIAAGHGMSGIYIDEFAKRVCSAVPLTYNGIISLARLTYRLLTHEELSSEAIRVKFDDSNRTDIEPAVSEMIFHHRESTGKRISLNYEKEVLERVRSGIVEALAGLTGSDGGTIGFMSQNPLNQAKFTLVSLVTLLARVAIESGVEDDMAFSLSDALCQRMDVLKDPLSVTAVSEEAMVLFTKKIGEVKRRRHYSPPVQKICDHIRAHLHEDLPHSGLADVVQLSPRALSARFHEEVGIKISEYIAQQRVSEAKYLLKYSSHSLCDIAQYLHYSTQSYFTLQFRRHTGMTPQSYRETSR